RNAGRDPAVRQHATRDGDANRRGRHAPGLVPRRARGAGGGGRGGAAPWAKHALAAAASAAAAAASTGDGPVNVPDGVDPREFALQLAVVSERLDERSALATQRMEQASLHLEQRAS